VAIRVSPLPKFITAGFTTIATGEIGKEAKMAEQVLPEKPSGDQPVPRRTEKGQRKREGVLRTRRIRRIRGKLVKKARLVKGRASRPPVRGGTQMGKARSGTDQTGLVAREQAPEGYIRFRMQVDDGRMSIIGSHFVKSTLATPPMLGGNFAYEVSDGENRLHVGSLADLGVTRSFANPSGPLELRRHHITPLSRYEFDVRVPAPALRRAALKNIQITLYRVKERAPNMVLGAAPLHTQFERELRVVARVQGIATDMLPREMKKPSRRRRTRDK
jgi:hypothetical protein